MKTKKRWLCPFLLDSFTCSFFVSKNVVFHLFFENIFVVKLKSTKQCRMPSTTHDCLKNRGCQPTRLSYKWNQNFIFVRNEIFKTKINRLNLAPIAMHCNGIYTLFKHLTLNCWGFNTTRAKIILTTNGILQDLYCLSRIGISIISLSSWLKLNK